MVNSKITAELVAEHGLDHREAKHMIKVLGREPNITELGIFSVMWSEHCSYKSSKKWLRELPTQAPWVIHGPGENAGAIDIGDGQAIIFKIESHNHPSFIEPYQGAATGVGGILRDVFTMGARPIANLNSLRFGAPENNKTRHLVSGVVSGIGGYGNCVGIPTVGGECGFHPCYDGNILVNAMSVGLVEHDRIHCARASGPGNLVIYLGAKTGRDGIHGATMASAEFDDSVDTKRPTVQVGDPFTEKLLLEACLELMATDAIVAIQDMGAAGLTSSSFEMASRGDLGIEIDLDQVPLRESKMSAYEIMLSESQERMLMVIRPDRVEDARKIFSKWQLDFAVIGQVTNSGRMVIRHQNTIAADLPIKPLADSAPEYDRTWVREETSLYTPEPVTEPDISIALNVLISCPDLASKRWIWEQYDHTVMADTVQAPGGDAAVVRVHGTAKGIALTTDCTPRYCAANSVEGGRQAVAECWRNLIAVGAQPLAITNCLNFGNPERPETMGQFVGTIEGMAEACRILNMPVVSGNVSFYNETRGKAVHPTPTIGGVGLIESLHSMQRIALDETGLDLILIGSTYGHLGASLYLREIHGIEDGPPPPVDLNLEQKHGSLVHRLIHRGTVRACHDVGDGGLLVAVAEMSLAGGTGARLFFPDTDVAPHAFWFGEDQGRYVLAVENKNVEPILLTCFSENIPAFRLGTSGGEHISVDQSFQISVADLSCKHETWFPDFMKSTKIRSVED